MKRPENRLTYTELQQAVLRTGRVHLSLPEGDVEIPSASDEYVALFWRPYLGPAAFALWDVLRSSLWFVEYEDDPLKKGHKKRKGDWPTIEMLAEMLGPGYDRVTILGRKRSSSRPAQEGILATLEREHLINVWAEGKGKHPKYRFQIRTRLPILAPAQAAMLPPRLQDLHRRYLDGAAGISLAQWERMTEATFIPRSVRLD